MTSVFSVEQEMCTRACAENEDIAMGREQQVEIGGACSGPHSSSGRRHITA